MILCVYGAGGFGKEVYDIATRMNKKKSIWDEILFLDDAPHLGESAYLGRLFKLETVLDEFGLNSIEVIVAIGEPAVRKKLYQKVKKLNLKLATLVDPSSIISPTSKLGEGVIVAPFCSISSSAQIGDNVAINTNSIIGHDIVVGEHSVISSFVNIGGACLVGKSSYLGMGVFIKENLSIGSLVIIGMGSVVFKDIPDQVIAMGNPARPLRRNENNLVFKKKA
jgi:sugar O-acyltransferase (sialic acid O-acetyltransferase NeuD family)